MKQTFQGLLKTGIPLIEYDGTKLLPTFTSDDIGIYIIIPKLSYWFNISIEQASHLFFYGILLLPCLIGVLGFLYYYQKISTKIISSFALILLMRQAYSVGDVYLSYYACVTALVPWSFYFSTKQYSKKTLLFMFLAGLGISFFHYIRAYSGLGVLFFMIALFVLQQNYTKKELLFSVLAFVAGIYVPVRYFSYNYHQSVAYAQEHLKDVDIGENKHVFWHSIYIGFGFLQEKNPDNIKYDDSIGIKKVQSINPSIKSINIEYEKTLKHEVINLIKNHWEFFIFTIFAKIGVLFWYLILFANIGLIAALFYRKPLYLEYSFFLAFIVYSIFPILAIPIKEYSLGFISLAALYGVISINYAIEYTSFSLSSLFCSISKKAKTS